MIIPFINLPANLFNDHSTVFIQEPVIGLPGFEEMCENTIHFASLHSNLTLKTTPFCYYTVFSFSCNIDFSLGLLEENSAFVALLERTVELSTTP